jgi:hypothetical protein
MNSCTKSKPTVYNPSINNSMEGGNKNRFGEPINSVEDAIKNGRPVTVAMDYQGNFGKQCNSGRGKSGNRCLMLVSLNGFDKTFPGYARKFPNLPVNSFLAMVEDTGGAFKGKGTGKIDIASRSTSLYRNGGGFSEAVFSIFKGANHGPQNWKNQRGRSLTSINPAVQSTGVDMSCFGPQRERGGQQISKQQRSRTGRAG